MGVTIWDKSGIKKPSVLRDITPEMARKIAESLNYIQKLSLKIMGLVYLDELVFNEWPGKAPLYLFKCNLHGFEINYPAGYNKILTCIECLKDINILNSIHPKIS